MVGKAIVEKKLILKLFLPLVRTYSSVSAYQKANFKTTKFTAANKKILMKPKPK